MVGLSQQIVITYPDDQTVTFYGALNEFTPGELTEGEMPTAEFSIEPTNIDSAGTEQPPVVA
jgi:hypothetical protein